MRALLSMIAQLFFSYTLLFLAARLLRVRGVVPPFSFAAIIVLLFASILSFTGTLRVGSTISAWLPFLGV